MDRGQSKFFSCRFSICVMQWLYRERGPPSAPHDIRQEKKKKKGGGVREGSGRGRYMLRLYTRHATTSTTATTTTTTTRKHHAHPPQLKQPRAPAIVSFLLIL